MRLGVSCGRGPESTGCLRAFNSHGRVAEPGFVGVQPGSGLIIAPPVSVCGRVLWAVSVRSAARVQSACVHTSTCARARARACAHLPVSVHDCSASGADDALKPLPRFRVQRLARAADDAQRAEVVLLHRRVAKAHQRADCGGRGEELRDPVALHNGPVSARVRVERRALEHERRDAVAERPVHHPRVPGDPAVKGEEREE